MTSDKYSTLEAAETDAETMTGRSLKCRICHVVHWGAMRNDRARERLKEQGRLPPELPKDKKELDF